MPRLYHYSTLLFIVYITYIDQDRILRTNMLDETALTALCSVTLRRQERTCKKKTNRKQNKYKKRR